MLANWAPCQLSEWIFRIDNTDHIFDVNKKQSNDHDQVDLVCPQPQTLPATPLTQHNDSSNRNASSPGSSPNLAEGQPPQQQERYIIYSVSKEEYDTCRLNGNSGRVVAQCDQQAGKSRAPPFTITFRSYSPLPNGVEFKPGQDYYFITALMGHLQDPVRRFAPCREQNMKVIFKVCCKPTSTGGQSAVAVQPSPSPPTRLMVHEPSSNRGSSNYRAPQQQQQVSSTRRPTVVTLKPYLAPAKPAIGGPTGQPLDEYLRALNPSAPSLLGQQPQPITVLPIEVLQAPVSEPPPPQASGNNGNGNSSSGLESSPSSDDGRNDIVQNDTAPLASGGPQPAVHKPGGQSVPAAPTRPFFPFDPTAPPEIIKGYERWTPTPLPPNLVHSQSRTGGPTNNLMSSLLLRHSSSQQQQQLEPAPWQAAPQQPARQNQQQTAPTLLHHYHRNGAAGEPRPPSQHSRQALYPHMVWSTNDHSASPSSSRDLISAHGEPQHHQTSSTWALAPAPFLLLLLLAGLLAYLHRRRSAG